MLLTSLRRCIHQPKKQRCRSEAPGASLWTISLPKCSWLALPVGLVPLGTVQRTINLAAAADLQHAACHTRHATTLQAGESKNRVLPMWAQCAAATERATVQCDVCIRRKCSTIPAHSCSSALKLGESYPWKERGEKKRRKPPSLWFSQTGGQYGSALDASAGLSLEVGSIRSVGPRVCACLHIGALRFLFFLGRGVCGVNFACQHFLWLHMQSAHRHDTDVDL